MFECCAPKWKTESIVEHKFDYINIDNFVEYGCSLHINYFFQYIKALRGIYMYVSDIVAVVLLFTFNDNVAAGSNTDIQVSDGIALKTAEVAKYVYPICVTFAMLILFFEMRKAYQVLKSRDISLAFTNSIVYRYLCFKKYAYFCFFEQINDMKTTKDQIALWVFFRLRDWKRLLFAEAPRIVIFIVVLQEYFSKNPWNPAAYHPFGLRQIGIYALALTVALFFANLATMSIAMLMYVPLMMEVRGNLKEYCCHKIDKRIAQLILLNEEDKKEQAMSLGLADDRTKHELLRPAKSKSPMVNQTGVLYSPSHLQPQPYIETPAPKAAAQMSSGVYYDNRERSAPCRQSPRQSPRPSNSNLNLMPSPKPSYSNFSPNPSAQRGMNYNGHPPPRLPNQRPNGDQIRMQRIPPHLQAVKQHQSPPTGVNMPQKFKRSNENLDPNNYSNMRRI